MPDTANQPVYRAGLADEDLNDLDARVIAAQDALSRAERDVAKLENFGLARLLAALRGRRATALEAARTSERAARAAFEACVARRNDVRARRKAAIEAERDDARWHEARLLAEGGSRADALRRLIDDEARATAALAKLQAAIAAGRVAEAACDLPAGDPGFVAPALSYQRAMEHVRDEARLEASLSAQGIADFARALRELGDADAFTFAAPDGGFGAGRLIAAPLSGLLAELESADLANRGARARSEVRDALERLEPRRAAAAAALATAQAARAALLQR